MGSRTFIQVAYMSLTRLNIVVYFVDLQAFVEHKRNNVLRATSHTSQEP